MLMRAEHRRQYDDKEDFTDLRRLNVNRYAGKIQPAFVTGIQVSTKGKQQEQQEHTESAEDDSVFRQKLQIDGGHENVGTKAETNSHDLDDQIPGKITVVVGTGDDQAAEGGNAEAQDQQDHVTFAEKTFQFIKKIAHDSASFLPTIIASFRPNVKGGIVASV